MCISQLRAKGDALPVYYDLDLYHALVIVGNTEWAPLAFPALGRQVKDVPSPAPWVSPPSPSHWLCGWWLRGRPESPNGFSVLGWFCLGGLLFFPRFPILEPSVHLPLGQCQSCFNWVWTDLAITSSATALSGSEFAASFQPMWLSQNALPCGFELDNCWNPLQRGAMIVEVLCLWGGGNWLLSTLGLKKVTHCI